MIPKNTTNIAKHGLAFDAVQNFDWDNAALIMDDRNDYGESRFCAFGFIGERLHALIFTQRGDDLRIISLRRANKREEKRYETLRST